MSRKNFTVLLLLSIPFVGINQTIVDSEVDESMVRAWKVANLEEYEGVYRFGMSEWESEFYLAMEGNSISVQVKDYKWVEEDENLIGWQAHYRNYNNVKIIGNKFYSDETEGAFVTYVFEGEVINGLKLNVAPNSYVSKYEIGIFQTEDKLKFISGRYPQTKFEIIPENILNSLSLADLKIMRNEIFARYDYIFEKEGEMAHYFSRQVWYRPLKRDVSQLLTEIEKKNIANIRSVKTKRSSP